MPRRRRRRSMPAYAFRVHARVTDVVRPDKHGSIVRRGYSVQNYTAGPSYAVRWDDGVHTIEPEGRLRHAHGGAAHRNRSAVGKRTWRSRNRSEGPKSGRQLSLIDPGATGRHATIVDPFQTHAFNVQAKKRLGKGKASTSATIDMFGGTPHAAQSAEPTQADLFGGGERNRSYGRWANRALGVVGTATGGGKTFRVSGRLELKKRRSKRVVEASEMPGEEFFGVPEDLEGPEVELARGRGRGRPPVKAHAPGGRRRGRLTKSAYLDAAEARANIPPDQLAAFDAVWRTLWPTGLATLSERFAEWVESHPAELAEYQMKYADKKQKEYERQERRAMGANRAGVGIHETHDPKVIAEFQELAKAWDKKAKQVATSIRKMQATGDEAPNKTAMRGLDWLNDRIRFLAGDFDGRRVERLQTLEGLHDARVAAQNAAADIRRGIRQAKIDQMQAAERATERGRGFSYDTAREQYEHELAISRGRR